MTRPSRVWATGHGAVQVGGSTVVEAGLSLRLRRDEDGTIAAETPGTWEGNLGTTSVSALSVGGLALERTMSDTSPPLVAQPGAYTLELVAAANAGTACAAARPDFGWNQGATMGYLLLAAG